MRKNEKEKENGNGDGKAKTETNKADPIILIKIIGDLEGMPEELFDSLPVPIQEMISAGGIGMLMKIQSPSSLIEITKPEQESILTLLDDLEKSGAIGSDELTIEAIKVTRETFTGTTVFPQSFLLDVFKHINNSIAFVANQKTKTVKICGDIKDFKAALLVYRKKNPANINDLEIIDPAMILIDNIVKIVDDIIKANVDEDRKPECGCAKCKARREAEAK